MKTTKKAIVTALHETAKFGRSLREKAIACGLTEHEAKEVEINSFLMHLDRVNELYGFKLSFKPFAKHFD